MASVIPFRFPTACRDCLHRLTSKGAAPAVWRRHRCRAPEAQTKRFDFFTGRMVESPLPFCRDVNTSGKCPHFAPRPGGKDGAE